MSFLTPPGDLAETPLAAILLEALNLRASGVLEVAHGGGTSRLWFRDGAAGGRAGVRRVPAARDMLLQAGAHRHRRALAEPRAHGGDAPAAGRDPRRDGRASRAEDVERTLAEQQAGYFGHHRRARRRARSGSTARRRCRSGRGAPPVAGPDHRRRARAAAGGRARRRPRSSRSRPGGVRLVVAAYARGERERVRVDRRGARLVARLSGAALARGLPRAVRASRRSARARSSRRCSSSASPCPAAGRRRASGELVVALAATRATLGRAPPARAGAGREPAGARASPGSARAPERSRRGARAAAAPPAAGDAEHGRRPVRRRAAGDRPAPPPARRAAGRGAPSAPPVTGRDARSARRSSRSRRARGSATSSSRLGVARDAGPRRREEGVPRPRAAVPPGPVRVARRSPTSQDTVQRLLRRGERGVRGALRRPQARRVPRPRAGERGQAHAEPAKVDFQKGEACLRTRDFARARGVPARRRCARIPAPSTRPRSRCVAPRPDPRAPRPRRAARARSRRRRGTRPAIAPSTSAGILARDEGDDAAAERLFRAAVPREPAARRTRSASCGAQCEARRTERRDAVAPTPASRR